MSECLIYSSLHITSPKNPSVIDLFCYFKKRRLRESTAAHISSPMHFQRTQNLTTLLTAGGADGVGLGDGQLAMAFVLSQQGNAPVASSIIMVKHAHPCVYHSEKKSTSL